MRKPVLRAAGITALILAIPAAMTTISDEWRWGIFDFVFMGALILGAGIAYDLVSRQGADKGGGTIAYRAAAALAIAASLILIWVNAAIGIIGDGPHNMLYGGVIATGLIGAGLSRLNARGLAITMAAMAAVQMLVPVIVLAFWEVSFSPGVGAVFALNAVFAAAFVAAGGMFAKPRWADSSDP